MLFSRRGLRKFCLFFVFLVLLLLFFVLFCFFFSPEIQGLVVLRNLFLKSYTFACGWEELSVIVRVTFSYAFFFSLFHYFISLSGLVVLSALGRPMCPGGKIGGKKL